ncbi:taste receptor type 2 member 40-like [Rhinophrynus dorsalis]
MLPIFVLVFMVILGATTMMGLVTNSLIVAVNLADKVKGKNFSPSDLILVTLGLSNITFQFTMIANDFLIFLWSDLYFSEGVFATFKALLYFPIFSSFWFTVCLCVYYYLQIVIFTHPFLVRLKLGISQLVPRFFVASVITSVAISVPALWSTYRDSSSGNFSSNHSLKSEPKLSITYLLTSNIIGCSLPLLLVVISNGLILRSLTTHSQKVEKNRGDVHSPRAEARARAARTVTCLMLLYVIFYISEILMFVDVFKPSSLGFCTCLLIIYTYSPAQSVILILGSPKLKKALLYLFRLSHKFNNEKLDAPKILFIGLKVH